MNTDDGDGDVVPQLVTLDEYLSDELDGKLKSFSSKTESENVENDTKKVPITILTGGHFREDHSNPGRIPWIWKNNITELHSKRGTWQENSRNTKW